MTQLSQSRCPNCGGELYAISEEQLQCLYCASKFENNAFQKKIATLQEFLDQTKIETVNNQRRNLYDAVRAKYISKNEVHQYATEIKKLLPDDFQANFYLEALSGDVKRINELIREINVEENYELLQPIVYFLVASLESEFLLELNLLIERAYKKRDPALYSRCATKISEEAEKVSAGVYETFMPRDVFIAYSSKDMNIVSKLCEDLEEQGFSCFVAARNLRHGVGSVENYDDALKEAMDNCTCFLFVSTENSRKFDCDAIRKEIPYIRNTDTHNAPAEFRNNYRMIPSKYKKPRIEYRLNMEKSATDRITDIFFDGYEWVYDTDGVIDRLAQLLYEMPDDDFSDEFAPVNAATRAVPAFANVPAHTVTSAPLPAPAPVKPKVCNHIEVIDPAIEPTCTEPGRTEGSHCALCGEILRQSVTIPARGHEFGMWKITKPASCTNSGEQERACHCGEKETKAIPSLGGHQPGEWETVKEATEEESGLKIKKCTVCGEHTDEEMIPKKQAPASSAKLRNQQKQKKSSPAIPSPIAITEQSEPAAPTASAKGTISFSKNAKNKPVLSLIALKTMNLKPSQGLEFKFNDDGKTCAVVGQGACVDKIICIPRKANGYLVTAVGTETTNGNGEFVSGFGRSIIGIVIPDTVTSIEANAFNGCSGLEAIVIPNSVTTIGAFAFCSCASLSGMEIPKTVTSIGESAFNGCAKLESAELPKNITVINDGIFWGCSSLKRIQIPNSVMTIGKNAFSDCAKLDSIQIPDSVVSIGQSAFYGCKQLKNVEIPDSVLHIGWGMFNGCTSLTDMKIPDTVTSIESYAFYGCEKLAGLIIPEAVTDIGSFVFDGCESLASMALPKKVSSIGEGTFRNCVKLAHMEIPNSVSRIGKRAFYGCNSLESLTFDGTKREWKRISTGTEWKEASAISEVECKNGNIKV